MLIQDWAVPIQSTKLDWMVRDLRKAVEHWVALGAGPFFIKEHVVMLDHITYRGKPTKFDLSVAMGQVGPLTIGLAVQHCKTPSPYLDMYESQQGHGPSYIYLISKDYDADYARHKKMGFTPLLDGISTLDTRMSFFDTRPATGLMTELVEDCPAVQAGNKRMMEATRNWNGKDPIRDLDQPMVRTK